MQYSLTVAFLLQLITQEIVLLYSIFHPLATPTYPFKCPGMLELIPASIG